MTGSESLIRLYARLIRTADGATTASVQVIKNLEISRGVSQRCSSVECLNLSDFGPWFKSCQLVKAQGVAAPEWRTGKWVMWEGGLITRPNSTCCSVRHSQSLPENSYVQVQIRTWTFLTRSRLTAWTWWGFLFLSGRAAGMTRTRAAPPE